jgi:3-isopropylmalate/(R)-2-methylmalate dehydratase small subunit
VKEQRAVSRIARIEGRGLPLRGHDVDTDRIIPARFLKAVRFEGLEAHVFEDERAMFAGPGRHPFDEPAYAGAAVLAVNRNFGCGSSREHAPQALVRWGIRAIVGESFSEIFFGNALALGLPCVSIAPDAAAVLQARIESDPAAPVVVDLEAMEVDARDARWRVTMPAAARDAFLTGAWDATGLLLERYEDVEAVAERLPYVTGFRR